MNVDDGVVVVHKERAVRIVPALRRVSFVNLLPPLFLSLHFSLGEVFLTSCRSVLHVLISES